VRTRQTYRQIVPRWLPSEIVNVIWRTLLVMWRARRRVRREGRLAPTEISRIRVTTLPTDLDILRHMNNGRYLSLFDLGRWDLLVRTGMLDVMKRNNWYAVVSSETITFRKSLELWQRFDVESRLIGHDDKAIYLEHRAVVDGEIYARAIIRSRMLKRSGGTLSHEELFAAVGRPEGVPEIEPWVHDWADATSLPPTRAEAPSIWN
jgi:acyl-CoA thioesterase FadM